MNNDPWGIFFYLAVSGIVAWQFYRLGRENERRQARGENNWWGGFRAGKKNAIKLFEEEAAKRGVTLTWRTGSDSQHN